MLISSDSVSSRRTFSRFVIYLNACGSEDDNLQAQQEAKGDHGASNYS
tara:strand:- start:441 stop:584 length:144 start_codon:yes stop_codon:yes gene_type:complete